MHSNIVYLNIFTVIDENQALVKPPKSMSWLVLCFYYDCVVDLTLNFLKPSSLQSKITVLFTLTLLLHNTCAALYDKTYR